MKARGQGEHSLFQGTVTAWDTGFLSETQKLDLAVRKNQTNPNEVNCAK